MSTHSSVSSQQAHRTGRMTALMRAASTRADGPRVLRIGLVQSGRVIEERLVKQRTTVSIGQSERATFVLPGAPDVELFEKTKSGYALNFTDAMTGRVVCEDGIKDLATLRARSERGAGVYRFELGSDARGKVVVGDSTFLFQFVEPPPPATRPQLPLAVKATFGGQVDWALTMVAAFSFMLHFGFIGAMYSDWSDQVVSEDVTVQGLADLLNNVPAPIAEEQPVDQTPTTTPTNTTTTTPTRTTSTNATANNPQPGHMNDHAALALSNRAEAMMMDIVGATNSPTVIGNAARGDYAVTDLTKVAESPGGTTPGSELTLTQSSANVQPGTTRLTDFGNTHIDPTHHVTVIDVKPPPMTFTQIDPIPDNTSIPHADGTIAGLKPQYRNCYNKGLGENSQMSGKVVLSVVVQPNGEVQSVTKVDGSGLSPKVEQCIIDHTQSASFEQGGGGTLRVPVSFFTQ